MSDILSQAEMDALLGALSPDAAPPATAGRERVEPDESGSVAVASPARPVAAQKIKPYDFSRPDRFSNENMRTLQMIHDNFGRLFAASLSTQLRTVVEIRVTQASQITFEEYCKTIPNPTNLNIISMLPLQGTAILEMNPTLVFTIIDRILGGPGNAPTRQRELTEIELTVAEKVVKRGLENLKEAWQHAAQLNYKLEVMESNPMFVQIVSPQETVAAITLEVKMKTVTSTMSICFPYVVLEGIISKLSAHQWYTVIKKESTMSMDDLKKNMQTTQVPLSVRLGGTRITVQQLLDLKKSDVVRLDNDIRDDLLIFVGNKLTFTGRPGVIRRRKGVQIISIKKGEE